MPKTPEQFQTIREEKKRLIQETAMELFAERGYANTSINMIARKAGISKGLIYNYFSGKEELVKDIMISGLKQMTDFFDPDGDGVLTEEEFEYYVEQSYSMIKNNTAFWKLYFNLITQYTVMDIVRNEALKFIQPFLRIMADYYKRKNEPHPEEKTRFFIAALDGVALNYIADPENFPLSRVKQMIIEQFK